MSPSVSYTHLDVYKRQEYTWAQPIPEDTFNGYNISLVAPLDPQNPVPSCRNADGPYHQGQYVPVSYTHLIHGPFLLLHNILSGVLLYAPVALDRREYFVKKLNKLLIISQRLC